MYHRTGARLFFMGYSHQLPDVSPIFVKGQIVAVAEVMPGGELICFPIDDWGRVYSREGDTLFPEEVLRLPLTRVPSKRFPRPYGEADNEGASWRSHC